MKCLFLQKCVTECMESEGRRIFKPGELRIFPGCNLIASRIMGVVSSADPRDIRLLYKCAIETADQENATSLCISGFGTG